MRIFLVRHGTRNFTLGDVPLNEEGLSEAKVLAENSRYSKVQRLLSSPKKRAQMTLQPLAEKYQLEIQCFEDLDQMKNHEGEKEFLSRVRNFLTRIEEGEFGSQTMICSHSDWLAAAAQVIPTDSLDLKYKMFQCAEVLEFHIEEGLWKKSE